MDGNRTIAMPDSMQEKIQQIELDTVKAVTEMKVDIRNLTAEVKDLNKTIVRMSENYVTKEEFAVYRADTDENIRDIKRSGILKAITTGVITAVIVAIVTYEVTKAFK